MMPPEAVLGYISDLPEEGSCADGLPGPATRWLPGS